MEITIPYIKRKFEEFNQQMFAGKLPMLPIKLSNAKTFLGMCCFKKRKDENGNVILYDFVLRINTRVEVPENVFEDTIIHEMIHYYIGYNQLKDTSPHGELFHTIMNGINEKYGRHISVSHDPTKEQKEQLYDTRKRWHVVAVVRFHDGRTGIKVLPRIVQRITNYYNKVLGAKEVASIQLYMSCDVFFNRFPNSSALNVCFLEESEIASHLKDAEQMECDGTDIIRNKKP